MRQLSLLLLLLLATSTAFAQTQETARTDTMARALSVKKADTSMEQLLSFKQTGTDFLGRARRATLHSDASQDFADSAIFYFQLAMPGLLAQNALDVYQEASREISDAFALKGSYKEALDAYDGHIKYRDSVNNRANAKKLLLAEMKITAQKAEDSVRAEGEKKALALRRDAALAALRYEYEQKQARAKTDAERRKYKFEEELRRREIEVEYNQTAASLEMKRQRAADLAKAQADKRAVLAAADLKRRNILMRGTLAGSVLLLAGAVIAFLAYRGKRRTAVIIASEQARNQGLLHNILPDQVAEELKSTGGSEARQYDDVSVLVTDFVNFSAAAESRSPQELVQELHECFSAFDYITESHGLEKIKTIGDAYLAVCGLPDPNRRHAYATIAAAIEIRDYMAHRAQEHQTFQLRIGIHSGTVVAGIVGMMKYGYDVWGDAVNITARMEREGTPGTINISEATYELVRDEYPCTLRGREAQSGLQMYQVEAPAIKTMKSRT